MGDQIHLSPCKELDFPSWFTAAASSPPHPAWSYLGLTLQTPCTEQALPLPEDSEWCAGEELPGLFWEGFWGLQHPPMLPALRRSHP